MSATAALAWRNVWSERVKMIADHHPTLAVPRGACDAEGRRGDRRREPQAKMDNAVRAAAITDGKRAAKSFSPKIL